MPRYKRKRKYRRRWRRKGRLIPWPKGNKWSNSDMLLGTKKLVKHRFFTNTSLDPAAAGVSVFPISANGLHDPETSGGAHQPRGFDQLVTLFGRYLVPKAFIKATFVSSPSTTLDSYACFIGVVPNATPLTTLVDYMELRNKQSTALGVEDSSKVLTMWCNVAAFHGYPHGGRGERDLHANTSSVPAIEAFFHVGVASVLGGEPAAIDVMIEVTYYVEWSRPALPPVSTA